MRHTSGMRRVTGSILQVHSLLTINAQSSAAETQQDDRFFDQVSLAALRS